MNQLEMEHHMEAVFEDIHKLRKAGQREYSGGPESDAFENFSRSAADLGLDRKMVLWIFAMKHRDGIASWLQGRKMQRDTVHGRIKDLIVYLLLLDGMIAEEAQWDANEIVPRVDELLQEEDGKGQIQAAHPPQ